MTDAIETMAYTGETPWHGLGTFRKDGWTEVKDLLKDAGLDWKVELKTLSYEATFEGKRTRFRVPSKALVRDVDNKVMTVVSKGWNPVQNEEAFTFFQSLVDSGKMTLETAGSVLGGKRTWALAKIGESFEVNVGGKKVRDQVDGYLLLTNPHEYGKSLDARLCATRVVCWNTLSAALGENGAHSVSLNHRRPFDAVKLQQLLGVAHLGMEAYKEQAEFLANKKADFDKVKEYFSKVFPFANGEDEKQEKSSKMAKAAAAILETQPGADMAPGTWWNAFNAVTFATDHLMGHNEDTRLASNWYGHNRTRKLNAMDKAIEYAKAA